MPSRCCAMPGWTSLVTAYRNDRDAPRGPDGRYNLGLSEWRDVEAAMGYAVSHGARRILLLGWSMGGAIVLQALDRSPLSDYVVGVALDSPVIDWGVVLRHHGRLHKVPGPLVRVATDLMGSRRSRRLVGVREPIDVARTDWVARADELRHPMLAHRLGRRRLRADRPRGGARGSQARPRALRALGHGCGTAGSGTTTRSAGSACCASSSRAADPPTAIRWPTARRPRVVSGGRTSAPSACRPARRAARGRGPPGVPSGPTGRGCSPPTTWGLIVKQSSSSCPAARKEPSRLGPALGEDLRPAAAVQRCDERPHVERRRPRRRGRSPRPGHGVRPRARVRQPGAPGGLDRRGIRSGSAARPRAG